jgi:hypothetical protein
MIVTGKLLKHLRIRLLTVYLRGDMAFAPSKQSGGESWQSKSVIVCRAAR